jgi:hypothetical protein
VILAPFYSLGPISRTSAMRWLSFVSLVFYPWWRPVNVLMFAPILLNKILSIRIAF